MKHLPEHINDDLLVKYLLGESEQEEQEAVDAWLQHSEANRRHYSHMQLIWEQSRQLAAKSTADTEAAWQRFRQQIAPENETAVPRVRTIALRPQRWSRIAAAAVLLLGLGWLAYYFSESRGSVITLHAHNETLTDTLPDGSVVTLQEHATFTYPRRFAANSRAVKLDGEAFFDIAPDKSKPFIISANGVSVKVVGTSFNIKSNEEKTTVVVTTGVVEVKRRSDAVVLHPHEQATVSKEDKKPVKKATDDLLYDYYKTRTFTCTGTPLWRLISVLSDAYDTEIVIADNELKNMQITSTFQNEPLENILAVIGETLNIRVEQEGRKFVLKPRQ